MKTGILVFHSNITKLYKKSWILKFIESINNQTYKNHDIIELNYGENENIKLFDNSIYINKYFKTHYDCLNYLLDFSFNEKKYENVMITNIDDYYESTKLGLQINLMNKYGYDIVSSNMCIFQVIKNKMFKREIEYIPKNKKKDFNLIWHIIYNIENNKNIIEHSGICISKQFYFDNKIHYDSEIIPFTILNIWKKTINYDTKIHIIDKPLTYQRIHNEQITNKFRDKLII